MAAFGRTISNRDFRRFNVEPAPYQRPPLRDRARRLGRQLLLRRRGDRRRLGSRSRGSAPSSIQGDVGFVDLLEHMGCTVERSSDAITVTGGGPLVGIDVDMNAISDTVMTLAAVALFADGPTRIRNVAHIRHKETDRIAALATELRKLGATVDEHPDGLRRLPAAVDLPGAHRHLRRPPHGDVLRPSSA